MEIQTHKLFNSCKAENKNVCCLYILQTENIFKFKFNTCYPAEICFTKNDFLACDFYQHYKSCHLLFRSFGVTYKIIFFSDFVCTCI